MTSLVAPVSLVIALLSLMVASQSLACSAKPENL